MSNRGLPYDESHCDWVAKSRGCIWEEGQCVCSDGGYYSRTGHRCWPPEPTTSSTTTSMPAPVPTADDSLCVSNRGIPYDESDCDWIGKSRGCVWEGGRCVCSGGGYYSKTGHRCWPAESRTVSPGTSDSLCLSNRGLPYDQSGCDWIAKSRGCVWEGGQCVCPFGGYYSKTRHRCWPSSQTSSPPSPLSNSFDVTRRVVMLILFLAGASACVAGCPAGHSAGPGRCRFGRQLVGAEQPMMMADAGHVEVVPRTVNQT